VEKETVAGEKIAYASTLAELKSSNSSAFAEATADSNMSFF
jgi:chromatin segregation and condensation protein Rec8/ScpA/Scc1 (kleisin family)